MQVFVYLVKSYQKTCSEVLLCLMNILNWLSKNNTSLPRQYIHYHVPFLYYFNQYSRVLVIFASVASACTVLLQGPMQL